MPNELKPCPFCGGEAEIKEGWTYGDPPHYYLMCKECGVRGGTTNLYLDGNTAEECIEICARKWNRRVDNA